MKIGFYGDSFADCVKYSEDTYLNILSKKLNAEIVHTGYGGSSVWDVVLKQFDPLNTPDICVFCWTHSVRLYHSTYRSLTPNSESNIEIQSAVDQYYAHLFNLEKSLLEYKSLLYWFDNVVLSEISKHKKIIHLWSIGERKSKNFKNWKTADAHLLENIEYIHEWKNGVEIKPALMYLSVWNNSSEQNLKYFNKETRFNHLEPYKHLMLASWIEQALAHYSDGVKLDFSNDIKL